MNTPFYQVPRNTLLWIFVMQGLVLSLHLARLPLWLDGLMALCIIWRFQVYRGRWAFPKMPIKLLLVLTATVLWVVSFPAIISLESLVSVLFIGYSLKLLEMHKKKDALVVVYLSYFLLMVFFLFEQAIVLSLYALLVFIFITASLIGLYQREGQHFPFRTFRLSSIILLQALPLMMVMFVVLPRIPAFWNVPLQQNSPKTGVSDSMSPGDFSNLVQSNKLALRVTFEDEIPPKEKLYWRGLVFSGFDGRRWYQSMEFHGRKKINWQQIKNNRLVLGDEEWRSYYPQLDIATSAVSRYQVIQEQTMQPWLFSLASPIPATEDIGLLEDFRLLRKGPVTTRLSYQVSSYIDHNPEREISSWRQSIETTLPAGFNPRSKLLAQRWLLEADSVEDYVERVMNLFSDEFYYSLKAPKLGKHSVDEFLFETKTGFCEHFASSFTFMMRAAGIPARVVVGYQGGEINPYENYLLLREYDAHAWAEVWLAGRGWVRFDPTFAVAPQRILDGFRQTFEDSKDLELSPFNLDSYRNSSLLNALRLQADRMNYLWAKWVLSYDSEVQMDFLGRLFGVYSLAKVAAYTVAAFSLLMMLVYLSIAWRERDTTTPAEVRLYKKFHRYLLRKGLSLSVADTPNDVKAKIENNFSQEDNKQYLMDIVNSFIRLLYSNVEQSANKDEIKHLKQKINKLKYRLIFKKV